MLPCFVSLRLFLCTICYENYYFNIDFPGFINVFLGTNISFSRFNLDFVKLENESGNKKNSNIHEDVKLSVYTNPKNG